MFPKIEIYGHHIGMFPLYVGIGLVSGVFLIFIQLKKMQSSLEEENRVMIAIPFCFLSGVAGGFLLDILLRGGINALFTNPLGFGLTFYGWLLTAILFLIFYAKCRKMSGLFLLNLFLPSFAIAQAFGRIGCFLGGCCYGRPAKLWGVSYPAGSLPYLHHGAVALHPVQLYESFYLTVVFIILFTLIRFKYRGAVYLILAALGRFFFEFLRNDDRGTLFFDVLSPSQWISCVLFAAGWIVLLKAQKEHVS